MITDPQSWQEAGFPDNLFFRRFYLAGLGLDRAIDERYAAALNLHPTHPPSYFFMFRPEDMFTFFSGLNIGLRQLSPLFVNPDKISSASSYQECFWTWNELVSEATEGEILDWTPYPFHPECPAKLAKQYYNAINLLRYLPTTKEEDWPDEFDYEDKNDTFQFKAP